MLGLLSPATAGDEGKIVRPSHRSILPKGEISIAATGPGARLELDGQVLPAHESFPNVFHAQVTPAPGEHSLALVWEGGRREIRFFVGDGAPEGFAPFRPASAVRHRLPDVPRAEPAGTVSLQGKLLPLSQQGHIRGQPSARASRPAGLRDVP